MPHRTRVKICGITNPRDAAAAATASADAIGMVFHAPAPRCITLDKAKAILDVLPPFVTPVGLFVDAPAREILDTAGQLRLRHVQLHGHESPAQVAELRGLSVIKVIRVTTDFVHQLGEWGKAITALDLQNLRGLVTDTAGTGEAGGTGVANDFGAIRTAMADGAFEGLPPLIVAGGLTPDNVGDVVRSLRPWAVDVSSGVERSRGIKSKEAIEAFITEVREADADSS